MATPNLSEIVTTTLRDRSGEIADNVSKGNAILAKTKEKGGWKTAEGRSILQEHDFQENGTFMWYSGSEVLNISATDVLSAFEYDWKQAATAIVWNGLEMDVQNTGKAQVIDLIAARMKNAERTMKNQIASGCYSDGTGASGKQIGGLQLLVADDPTTGIVGGVNRANYTYARNKVFDASVDGTGAVSATNIQNYMNGLWLRCTRGSDQPDLNIADSNYYRFFETSLQAIQRLTDPTKVGRLGFPSLAYKTADVVYEDNSGMPASHMYFLNTDYLFFRYASKRNFKPMETVKSINQDAWAQFILFAGNLTCSNFQLHGVMHE